MNKKISVLLIEDNPGDARLIREYLSEAREVVFECESAATLAKGLERIDEDGVDIVLLDLTLPDSAKEDTFQRARAHSPGLPIVILSGFDDREFALGLVRMGAQDYLMKGELNSDILSRVILYAIERKRTQEVMNLIVEGTSSVVGEEFFNALVKSLAEALRVDIGFIATIIDKEGDRAKMLSWWDHNALQDPFEYDLKGAPCDMTIKESFYFCPSDVADHFPDDPLLRENGIESYLAVRLKDAEGNVLGHMGAMHRKPMSGDKGHINVLKIFAGRASAELERISKEAELEESKNSLDEAQRIGHVGNWEYNLKSKKTTWSDNLYRLYGVDAGFEPSFKKFIELVHPDDRSRLTSFLDTAYKGPGEYELEQRIIRPDGEERLFFNRFTVEEDEEGNPFLMRGINQDITERRRIEKEIKRDEEKLSKITSSVNDAIILIDQDGNISYWNPSAENMFGYSANEVTGRHLHSFITPERYREAAEKGFSKFRKTGEGALIGKVTEIFGLRKTGEEFPLELSISSMELHGRYHAVGIIRDITERKDAEERIKSLSRTLKAVSSCNKALIRAKDESRLLADICRIVVETGVCRLAWVGEAVERNGERLVKPLSCSCSGEASCDYLNGIRITWSDDEFGRGPTGTAIRTGKPAVMRSIEHDPLYAPWRDKALKHGFRSSITLPLVVSGKMFGALNIYSGREDAFDREELELLEELASDLAFGLTTLRTLKEKEMHGRLIALLLNSTSEGVYGVDTNGNCTFVNASCLKMFGYDDESELLGKNMYSLLYHTRSDGTSFPLEECPLYHAYSKGKNAHVDDEFFRRKDGTNFPVSYRAVPIFSEGKLAGAVVTFLDITEQLRAREALERSGKQLKSALDGAITAVSRMVEARDPYTSGHEERVALLARKIAREMGLDENIVEGIRMGATIHDIGKIHLPAEILSKPTTLTPVEFDLIKAHPQTGHDILADISFPWPVADIAWQHHEKLDGSGYPQGLKNGEICLEARIVAVADVVEAMASHRPYRPALGIDKALEEIKAHRGDWYEPEAVDACVKLFTEKGFSLNST